MHFRDHLLLYILVPLLVIFSSVSFYRFIILNDYIVAYKIACDPAINNCFVECQDSECTEKDYYAQIQKHAGTLRAQCGKDITDCEAANVCFDNDRDCSVIYNDMDTSHL